MQKNKVWRVTSKDKVLVNRRLLGTKWVFKVKKKEIFKPRLVTQGYVQIPGIDLKDNCAPVIYKTTSRIILVLWATYNWETEIIDNGTAFLYGDLEEDIYLKTPKSYSEYSTMLLNREPCLILDHALCKLVQADWQIS